MLLAGIFFVQNKDAIIDNFGTLGLSACILIMVSIGAAALISLVMNVVLLTYVAVIAKK